MAATFVDSSGGVHTQRSSFAASFYTFEPGERVTIFSDPHAPQHSKIDSFQTVWLVPLIFTGFGLLFGGFAYFWLFAATRGIKLEKSKDGVGAYPT
jgi:hypothetical protein